MNRLKPAAAKAEALAPPDDGVGGVAPGPEEEAEGVAEWKQQEVAQHLAVTKKADGLIAVASDQIQTILSLLT